MGQIALYGLCFGAGFLCCLIAMFLLLSKGTSDIERNGL